MTINRVHSIITIKKLDVNKLKINDIIQFERFGFVKLEEKWKNYKFVFSHK